jgi:hypothetical protein
LAITASFSRHLMIFGRKMGPLAQKSIMVSRRLISISFFFLELTLQYIHKYTHNTIWRIQLELALLSINVSGTFTCSLLIKKITTCAYDVFTFLIIVNLGSS